MNTDPGLAYETLNAVVLNRNIKRFKNNSISQEKTLSIQARARSTCRESEGRNYTAGLDICPVSVMANG